MSLCTVEPVPIVVVASSGTTVAAQPLDAPSLSKVVPPSAVGAGSPESVPSSPESVPPSRSLTSSPAAAIVMPAPVTSPIIAAPPAVVLIAHMYRPINLNATAAMAATETLKEMR